MKGSVAAVVGAFPDLDGIAQRVVDRVGDRAVGVNRGVLAAQGVVILVRWEVVGRRVPR